MKIKHLSASLFCLLGIGNAATQTVSTAEADASAVVIGQPIEVRFRNVSPEAGTIWISLCSKEELPKRDEGACRGRAQISATEGAKYVFEDISAGVYALTAYHDEDNNGWLDFDTRGLPIEATGNSQNAVGSYGPPTFEQMKFELKPAASHSGPHKLVVTLRRLSLP